MSIKLTKLQPSSPGDVKHIYHMADIHIRLNAKRHQEYREVFERVYDLLKKEPNESIVVICGDIFHSKTELSPECIDMAIDFFKNLSNIMDTFIIMGNHDGN